MRTSGESREARRDTMEMMMSEIFCEHLHVTVEWKLYAIATREEPAEYVGKAFCDDCGVEMEPEDVPEDAERKEIFV